MIRNITCFRFLLCSALWLVAGHAADAAVSSWSCVNGDMPGDAQTKGAPHEVLVKFDDVNKIAVIDGEVPMVEEKAYHIRVGMIGTNIGILYSQDWKNHCEVDRNMQDRMMCPAGYILRAFTLPMPPQPCRSEQCIRAGGNPVPDTKYAQMSGGVNSTDQSRTSFFHCKKL